MNFNFSYSKEENKLYITSNIESDSIVSLFGGEELIYSTTSLFSPGISFWYLTERKLYDINEIRVEIKENSIIILDKYIKMNEISYYGEFSTDKFIREKYFPDLTSVGVMMEVGAGPPEFYSMSKHFRDNGWRCICVDPNPKFIEQHKERGNEIYQFALSSENKKESNFQIVEDEFGWDDNFQGISSSAIEIKDTHKISEKASIKNIQVEIKTLDTLLEELNVKEIDFLSVDVEGWELEVMRGFKSMKPKVILLENYSRSSHYEEYMKNIGYRLDHQIEYNYIFIKEERKIVPLSKYGTPYKKPVIRVNNVMGVGDLMMITPVMKKLNKIYKQKVDVILPNKYSHNILTNEYFFEFIKNNPSFGELFDWETFKYSEEKHDLYNVFNFDKIFADWNSYYYCDLKQLCAFNCGFTLKEDELNTIYVPEEYQKIELPEHYVCINPAVRGAEREWEKEKWQDLVNKLNYNGIYVVSIGRDSGEEVKHYYNLDIKLGIDLAGNPIQNNLSQTWHIINNSDMFVSFDTGTYLFAGTTDAHIILCGWSSDPYYHQSYRNGSKYYKFSHVRGGCQEFCLSDPKWDMIEHSTIKERHPCPKCELNIDFACKPSVDQILNEIKSLYSKKSQKLTTETFGNLIDKLSIVNLKIWKYEDIKRESNDDHTIAEATRKTNILNSQRNDLIQQIDEMLIDSSKGIINFKNYEQGRTKSYGK